MRVTVKGVMSEALSLSVTCLIDPVADGLGGFSIGRSMEIIKGNAGYFNMDINTIQQRTGEFGEVTVYLAGVALAGMLGITKIPTGTGIRRRHQHESAGEGEGARYPGYGHHTILKGLA